LPQTAEGTDERSLYPGSIALILAVIALVAGPSAAALHTGLLLVSVDLSLGMHGLLYPWLLDIVPPLASLRAPARFGALAILSLSILGAMGAATVTAWRRAPRRLGGALVALMLVEYWAAPVDTRHEPTRPPAVYAWLAGQPRAVIVELPLPVPEALWAHETEYQLMSIYHWQTLANGYSGNAPDSYVRFLHDMRSFPDDDSLRVLHAKQVRWIVIHESLFDRPGFASLMERVVKSPALRSLGTYADRWGQATVLELTDDKSVSALHKSVRPGS
jgi:hypothetical protein